MNPILTFLLQQFFLSLQDYEFAVSLRQKQETYDPGPQLYDESSGISDESLQLMQLSLRNYVQGLVEENDVLKDELTYAVTTSTKQLILFCTEDAARWCDQNIEELRENARLKLGVEGVYIAEADSREPPTVEEVREVVQEVVNDTTVDEEEDESEHETADMFSAAFTPDSLLSLLSTPHAEKEEEAGYSLKKIYEVVEERGLQYVPLPKSLCQDILDFLWEEDKINIFSRLDE